MKSTITQSDSERHGHLLLLVQAGWVVLALLSLTFFIWELPERFAKETLAWFTTNPAPATVVREGLGHLHIPAGLYASYVLALYVVRAAVCYLSALLLFRRKSGERVAMFVSFFLLALPVADVDPRVLQAMAETEPLRAAIGTTVETVGFTLVLWLLLLFPDGHFQPRATRVLAAVWLLAGVGALFFPNSPFDMLSWPIPLLSAAFIPICATLAIATQFWRYRRISNPVERQQTKWFGLGLGIVLVEFAIGDFLTGYKPIEWPVASPTRVVLADVILYTVHNVAFLTIPLTLAIAVSRYHLWAIDRIINRSLTYAIVTLSLLMTYLASVFILSGLFRAVTSESSPVITAASTLVVAALFRPLRSRVQSGVDRRFYRQQYDAQRTLHAFGIAARDAVDLDQISGELTRIVAVTMQPEHVSIWLRSPSLQSERK